MSRSLSTASLLLAAAVSTLSLAAEASAQQFQGFGNQRLNAGQNRQLNTRQIQVERQNFKFAAPPKAEQASTAPRILAPKTGQANNSAQFVAPKAGQGPVVQFAAPPKAQQANNGNVLFSAPPKAPQAPVNNVAQIVAPKAQRVTNPPVTQEFVAPKAPRETTTAEFVAPKAGNKVKVASLDPTAPEEKKPAVVAEVEQPAEKAAEQAEAPTVEKTETPETTSRDFVVEYKGGYYKVRKFSDGKIALLGLAEGYGQEQPSHAYDDNNGYSYGYGYDAGHCARGY